MSYTEACSPGAASMPAIAFGRDGIGQTGIVEELLWTDPDVKFTPAQARDQAYFETLVAEKKVIVIGKVKPESQNTDSAFAEDADLGLKDLDTKATRATRYQLVVCACTNAELARLDGFNGRLLERTKKGFVNARVDEDGNVMGKLTSSLTVGLRTTPVSGTPWAYTIIDATFDDGFDDDKNPYEYKNGWPFKEIKPTWRAEGAVSGASSGSGSLTFTLTFTQGCSTEALTGAVLANFKLTDTDGNEITIDSVSETGTTGVYAFSATTAVTSAYVEVDGVQDIDSSYYVSDKFAVTV